MRGYVSKMNLLILLFCLFPVFSDAATAVQAPRTPVQQTAVLPSAPDYAKASSWSRRPDAKTALKEVDVFYIYPTVFGGNGPANMNVRDASLWRLADVQVGINEGVFAPTANFYAPYYRQASIEILDLDDPAQQQLLAPAYQDIIRAFDYYVSQDNGGRPFILAGFSQGSMAILELMKARFNDPGLRQKLVAAYIIGYSVTEDDLKQYPWLRMAEGETDTGVIISYNTQLPGSGYSYVLRPGAKAINPVNWRTDRRMAQKKEHKGAVIFDIQTGKKQAEIPAFTAAYLEKETRALVVKADAKVYHINQPLFPPGVLHMYDYMFFYNNLKDNVAKRSAAWLEQNQKAVQEDL